MMVTERKPFFKINFEDLELAKEFFENPKHYSEWLYAISEYYQGNLIEIKTKIVLKYFNNYKKTMDFILKSKEFGKKGQLKNTENKEVTTSTLQGVLEVPFKEPSQLNINNKLLIINNKELNIKEKKIPSLFEFMEYYKTELSLIFPNLDFQVETKYEAWVENKWKDGNNNQIKNWKTKLKSTLPYLKPQTNGKSNNTAQGREDALRDWGRMASSTSNNEGN